MCMVYNLLFCLEILVGRQNTLPLKKRHNRVVAVAGVDVVLVVLFVETAFLKGLWLLKREIDGHYFMSLASGRRF
jgi:hypothetical protein